MAEVEQQQEKQKPKKRPDPITIYRRWCKACGICIEMCPKNVFDTDQDGYPVVAHGMDCTQCAICWLHCPDFAITSNEK
jgi:2-oxoglutarate ferredoxin oxidoreductase subunit delta